MTLNEYIKKLEEIKAIYGGDIDVVKYKINPLNSRSIQPLDSLDEPKTTLLGEKIVEVKSEFNGIRSIVRYKSYTNNIDNNMKTSNVVII